MWIIFVTILLSCLSEGSEINIALRKPTYMGKPTWPRTKPNLYPPWRAVDGILNNTKYGLDEAAVSFYPFWFVVDLKGWYVIKRVNLYTRMHCCGDGTSKFLVGLFYEFDQKNFIMNQLCGRYPYKTKTNRKYTLYCKQPYKVTRFVSISRNYNISTRPDFGLTELEVYGEEYDLTMKNYVGCFEISNFEKVKTLISPNQCISHCLLLDYSMAALKIRNNFCFCVKILGIKLSNLMCSNICPNNKLLCGGNNLQYSVYKTTICVNSKSYKVEPCEHFCGEGGKDLVGGKCSSGGCQPGYKGEACDQKDCSKNSGGCGNHSSCVIENVKNLQISDCFCNQGYEEEMDSNCVDVDECARRLDKCNSTTSSCLNTEGSYKCLCYEGFREIDEHRCQDLKKMSDPLHLSSDDKKSHMIWGMFGLLHIVALATLIPIIIYLVKRINKMITIVEK